MKVGKGSTDRRYDAEEVVWMFGARDRLTYSRKTLELPGEESSLGLGSAAWSRALEATVTASMFRLGADNLIGCQAGSQMAAGGIRERGGRAGPGAW